jgi:hypothetical protein
MFQNQWSANLQNWWSTKYSASELLKISGLLNLVLESFNISGLLNLVLKNLQN